MTDDAFIAAFEAAKISRPDWTHEAHIRMAWIYATRTPDLIESIVCAREGIQRLNAANGVGEELYHETVTAAFMTLVHARLVEGGTWEEFRAANPALFDRDNPILHRYYTPEIIKSDLARTQFVKSDLRDLDS